ncbi:hypothetical protein AAG906_011610 [Vitis piasezkii]
MEGGRQVFSSKIAKLEIPSLQRRKESGDMGSFEEELWARFRPNECEDFDEALSRVEQVGSLWDYPKEFENCTTVWKDGHKSVGGDFHGRAQTKNS